MKSGRHGLFREWSGPGSEAKREPRAWRAVRRVVGDPPRPWNSRFSRENFRIRR